MCTCFFLFNRARDLFITARLHNHYFAKSVKKKHIMKKNSMFWKEFDQYSSATQWWKIIKKKSPFTKMLQLRYQRKVTWARFARTGWVTKSGNSNPVYVTMSGISPVSMITKRDPITMISFTLLINLPMQFLLSFKVGVLHYIFFTRHDLFIENFLLGFGGVAVVTLTFMLHCLLQ